MSHIHLQDIPALMKKCKEAIKSAGENGMNDTFRLLTDIHEILYKSLEERRAGEALPPTKDLNLERRLDLAAQWVADVNIQHEPDCRAIATTPHAGWCATVKPDRIGNARQVFVRYADSPSDALSLALSDAAAWAQKARDVR